MSGRWTARELCEAIGRLDRPDLPLAFVDLDGVELPFRWMNATDQGVVITLNVHNVTVFE